MSQELKDEIKRLFDVTPEDVNSVSYGFKYKNGEKTGQLSIIFGVNQKKSANELKPDEVLPKEIVVDGKTYITDVVQNEIPNLQQCYPDPADPNIQRLRGNPSLLKPMRGGQEIIQFPTGWTPSGGGGYNISVGTLGFFAVDNTDNKIVGVTNSHVVCDERVYCDEQNINVANASPYNTCQVRPWTNVDPSNSYFPGALVNDAGAVELAGYNIKRYQPVSNTDTNYVDGALLIMNNDTPSYVDSNSYMVWQPIGTPDYTPYMPFATAAELDNLLVEDPPVYSTGRTTGPKGYTAATDCALKITEIHVNSYVNDNGQLQYWGDCIKYAYEDGSSTPSAGGDSGSAVLADIGGTRKIIGLLFAGSTNFTLVNRIDRVASALNIRAWDASYSINLNQPSPVYKVCNLALGYGGIDSVVLDGVTYYQAGFTLTTALPTMPPVPSNSPSPTPSPSPSLSPSPTPSPSPSPSPSPTPSPTPFVLNELWGVGLNTGGQLSLGNAISRSSPVFMGIPDYYSLPQGNFGVFGITLGGNLWAWGGNTSGQLGLNNVANRTSRVLVGSDTTWAFATGGTMSFAVKTDGTLWTTGSNINGGLGQNDTVSRSSWTQVGTDTDWSPIGDTNPNINYGMYVRKNDGTLWACGDNGSGQLGDGTTIDRSSLVQMGSENYWAAVQSNNLYTYALDNIGRLWVVGYNANGRNGNGTGSATSSFVQVYGGHTWSQFAAGSSNTYAIRNDGTLWAWGIGSSGALANNSVDNLSIPTQIGTASNWAYVAAGGACGAAVNTDGQLWVWGANANGQLGTGDIVEYSSPVQTVIADNQWRNVFIGTSTLFGWRANQVTPTPSPTPSPTMSPTPTPSPSPTSDITQYNWGDNAFGSLGIASSINKSTPAFVAGSQWIDGYPNGTISNGGVRTDGTLWVVGYNARGCLGLGNLTNRNVYTQVGSGTDWAMVSMGITSGGVKKDGSLFMWGEGAAGSLGDGTVTTKSSPIQIAADKTWQTMVGWVATTAGGVCGAITTSGELWMWGVNSSGQLGQNDTVSRSSPVQVGTNSDWAQIVTNSGGVMALKTNGTLWGWGSNGVNLGYNNSLTRSTPVQVGTDSNWTQISGNQTNFAGMKNDYTVWVWGGNAGGQLGLGNVVTRSSPTLLCNDGYEISAGHTCLWVLKRDGSLWFTGSNTVAGQAGNNTVVSVSSLVQTSLADNNWTHIFSGGNVSMGIRNSSGLVTPTVTPSSTATPTPTPTPT
jgi:alpha-tubulin suppressor-like RCC1 family protein